MLTYDQEILELGEFFESFTRPQWEWVTDTYDNTAYKLYNLKRRDCAEIPPRLLNVFFMRKVNRNQKTLYSTQTTLIRVLCALCAPSQPSVLSNSAAEASSSSAAHNDDDGDNNTQSVLVPGLGYDVSLDCFLQPSVTTEHAVYRTMIDWYCNAWYTAAMMKLYDTTYSYKEKAYRDISVYLPRGIQVEDLGIEVTLDPQHCQLKQSTQRNIAIALLGATEVASRLVLDEQARVSYQIAGCRDLIASVEASDPCEHFGQAFRAVCSRVKEARTSWCSLHTPAWLQQSTACLKSITNPSNWTSLISRKGSPTPRQRLMAYNTLVQKLAMSAQSVENAYSCNVNSYKKLLETIKTLAGKNEICDSQS